MCLQRLGIGGVWTLEKHGTPGLSQGAVYCQRSFFELLQALSRCNRRHGEHGRISKRRHSLVGATEHPLTQVEQHSEMIFAEAER